MVSCILRGRLGNQMFQIAAAIGYAFKQGMDYSIPSHTLNSRIWPAYFYKQFEEKLLTSGSYTVYKESSHAYVPIPPFFNVILDGYFQSYKYFDFCLPTLRNEFGFHYLMNYGVVGIHVRRGDYLQYPDKHPVVKTEYVHEAIRVMMTMGYKHFRFFSDDIDWCFAMPKPFPGALFSYSQKQGELEDFSDLMNCEHQIISNSTFSWWAAMLNPNPNKIVITPDEDNWFGPGNKHLDVSTLLPKNWNRIKY